MAYVHIDPNSMEAARQDQERLSAKQTDAIAAREHRDEDLRAAESQVSEVKPRSLLARLRAMLHLDP